MTVICAPRSRSPESPHPAKAYLEICAPRALAESLLIRSYHLHNRWSRRERRDHQFESSFSSLDSLIVSVRSSLPFGTARPSGLLSIISSQNGRSSWH